MNCTLAIPLAPAPAPALALHAACGTPIGWRHGGLRAGPRVLAGVGPDLLEPLHRHLAALPTLPWMRGRVDLIEIDALADDLYLPRAPVDATISLMTGPADQAARTLLRLCTRLGMVAGRGLA